MKILMIAPVPFFAPRGTPIAILGRLRAMSSLGHEVDILTYHVGQELSIPGIRIYRTPSFKFIKEVPVGPSIIKIFLDFFVVMKAFTLLIRKRYDLIHTHEEGSIFGSMLGKLFKVPHLYDFHSSIPQALNNFGYDQFPLLIRFFEWLERIIIRSTKALIATSPELANYIRKIDKHIPIVVIENIFEVVDSRNISEESLKTLKVEYSLLEGEKIVLYVGTFEPYQGLDLLVDSAELVAKQFNRVKFVIVGGRSGQIHRLMNRIRDRGLTSFFIFTGIRPPEEIPMFLNIANVLVSPRIKGQNPPLKIYAYLHSGKPIVATNHISHTQVLNSEIAYLVEPNPEALAFGLLSILGDNSLAGRLGEKARSYFERRYSYKNFVDLTEMIIQVATN